MSAPARVSLLALVSLAAACASGARSFPLREPFTLDTDLHPVSVPCRADPTPKEPQRVTCAPQEYVSPFAWNQIDNLFFAPLSRAFSLDITGEAANANSLDEVADSAWITNRVGDHALTPEQMAMGACSPDDLLPATDEVADGTWVIDHGKDNGSTPGFRVVVPGKGQYLLKADDPGRPERASAASVIGAALYNAVGFSTSCEQIVVIRKAQLKLTPGLKSVDNVGISTPFDDAALDRVLKVSTQVAGNRVRLQASKWLPALPIGPFRYVGTREDDPNDIIDHEDRRELRGSMLLAAWLNHWDAREQNSMDVWFASDAKHKRSSPGYVRHYILDTSDTMGGTADPENLAKRLGHSYTLDFGDILLDFITLGAIERPWDRAAFRPGFEKFAYFTVDDFDPANWKPLYPNPAFNKMTERDGAWMARIIARFSPEDIRTLVSAGRFSDPRDVEYLNQILLARQHKILERFFSRLSPLGDIHDNGPQICAVDFARLRGVYKAERFRYTIIERGGSGKAIGLAPTVYLDGQVCFRPQPIAPENLGDADPGRIVTFEIRNGTIAGPLEIHTYDLGARGMRIVGATRPQE